MHYTHITCVPVSFTSDDGELSHKEFIKVMKSRTTRGLEKVGGVQHLDLSLSQLNIVVGTLIEFLGN